MKTDGIPALSDCDAEHPLNKEIILTRTKKYLASPHGSIAFSDLFESEEQRAYGKIMQHADYHFVFDSDSFRTYLGIYQNAVDPLLPMSISTVRWGKSKHFEAITDILVKLAANPIKSISTYTNGTLNIHYWVAVMLWYTIGIACVKYGKYSLLNALFHLILPKYTFSEDSDQYYILKNLHPCYWDAADLNKLQ